MAYRLAVCHTEPVEHPAEHIRYDAAERRQSRRSGRERGIHIYIAAAELRKAGIDPDGPPPKYRVWGSSRGDGGVTVRLYRD